MLSFVFPFTHDGVENILKHVLFDVHDVKVMAKQIGLPIRKLKKDTSGEADWSSNKEAQKRYFALPNYGSNQN